VAAAFVPQRNLTVVYGGRGPSDVWVYDTWTWDGTTWTSIQQTEHPVLRFAMGTFDARIGKVVVYGLTSDYSASQTWTWDGTWVQVTSSTSPPLRLSSAMAYDAKSGNVILFGGRGLDLTYLGDTWVFDGANWTRLNPQTSPSPRQDPLLASVAQGVLLFGGVAAGARLADTWSWDGIGWQAVPTLHEPHPMWSAGMTTRNGQAVLVAYAALEAQAQTYVMSQGDWTAI
jgi:hypothetical protein